MHQTVSGVNFVSPDSCVSRLKLLPGTRVADFGAGLGAFSLAAAKAVTSSGRVYAVEVQKDVLSRVKDGANKLRLSNVEVLWGDIEHPGGVKLRDGSVGAVIVANVLFQLESPYALAVEAKRVLESAGKLLVVDWKESFSGMGPEVKAVVSEGKAKDIFIQAGFELIESFVAGPHHYGLIFTKN